MSNSTRYSVGDRTSDEQAKNLLLSDEPRLQALYKSIRDNVVQGHNQVAAFNEEERSSLDGVSLQDVTDNEAGGSPSMHGRSPAQTLGARSNAYGGM